VADASTRRDPVRDRLGRPLRELRVSVTDRCNFRCGYCMPADGAPVAFAPRARILRFEEIERLVRLMVEKLGVRKVRLTGGEPLTRRELPRLCEMLSRLPGVEDLSLTTNGTLLADQAGALARAGLRRVTVSLDALDAETFRRMSGGRGDVARVLAGIEAARQAGLSPIKVNCVVKHGENEHAVVDLARHFRGQGVTVRFIEYMDVGTVNGWAQGQVLGADRIAAELERLGGLRRLPARVVGEVAERHEYADGSGEVGIIASVSRPFCRDCSRARLSAEGRLLTCLFASDGLDLRGPLRDGESDRSLLERMRGAWLARDDRYSELRAERAAQPRRRLEMFQVGG
jgi:cyclic pyranopterin phosphate synthase